MSTGKKKLSRSFQNWLLLLVIAAFLTTTAFLWIIQTKLAMENTVRLLELNILDVRSDIKDASDENLLELTEQIAREVNGAETVTGDFLTQLSDRYDVTDINCVNREGIIYATTFPEFLNYNMAAGEQSEEFLVLLEGASSYVQRYQPVSYDASISRKYAAVALEDGGFVQVGYGFARFRQDIEEFVIGVTRNRHVGEGGCMIIADESLTIVSDPRGNEGRSLDVTGIFIDRQMIAPGQVFSAEVYGEECYCMYKMQEGYTIVAAIPGREAALSRNVAVSVTTAMQIVIFSALFIMIFVLVKKLVVDNILKINGSLAAITDGELDTVVDVRSHQEFAALSDDINSTVDTLKRYISDAEARIDAELAFAKAIQHSALPSVFPPYPNRKEFAIWACMDTAKEVGGDFYDFYFVDEDTLAFLIADVSGKGIPAAMFMMQAKTLLKSYAESGMGVAEVLTQANNKLCEGNEADMFVTVWMGYLNTKTGEVTYANAGHNPPFIRHGDGSVEMVRSRPGLVLAGMEGIRYRTNTVQLKPGDLLYLYTDGVTEATDAGNNLYGEARLEAVLQQKNVGDVETVCRQVKENVDNFVGDAPQFDDITMLALKYTPAEEDTV